MPGFHDPADSATDHHVSDFHGRRIGRPIAHATAHIGVERQIERGFADGIFERDVDVIEPSQVEQTGHKHDEDDEADRHLDKALTALRSP